MDIVFLNFGFIDNDLLTIVALITDEIWFC